MDVLVVFLGAIDTSDYASMVLSIPNIPPMSVLTLFFLGLIRIAPIVSLAPFLGSKLPGSVKIGLAIALTAVLLPHIIFTAKMPPPTYDLTFLIYSLKEFLIGMIIAFLATIPFYIAQSSGVLIDFLRGSSALQVTDPFMQTQTSPIGILYNYVFVVLFYQIDGPFFFLNGVYQSYNLIPADAFINTAFFSLQQPFWKITTSLLTQFISLAMQLAAPSLVAILMGEMFLGIANRLAPQVQFAFLGIALKSLLAIALLWAGWFFILEQLGKQSLLWLQQMDRILQSIPK